MARKLTKAQEEHLRKLKAADAGQRADVEKLMSKSVKSDNKDIDEIGCLWFRLGKRTVKVVGWNEKGKSVNVEVDGKPSSYSYPFHKGVYHPYTDFSTDGQAYMDKFSNSRKVKAHGCVYGVRNDAVWYMNNKYLSTDDRIAFGSFSMFIEGVEVESEEKSII